MACEGGIASPRLMGVPDWPEHAWCAPTVIDFVHALIKFREGKMSFIQRANKRVPADV